MIKDKIFYRYICFCLIFLFISGCRENYTPKPRAYVRLDLPAKEFTLFDSINTYCFEYPKYAEINTNIGDAKDQDWFNIDMPSLNGRIYMSYKNIDGNLNDYIEDSRAFVYKHTIKADLINEMPVYDNDRRVYGILYDIKGNTASNIQFFLTDSIRHFLRGALYFDAQPDKDSLSPVINFVREDIIHLINTLQWK